MSAPGPARPVVEAFAPAEIARKVEDAGVAKTYLPVGRTLLLAVTAGAFIALGGSLTATIGSVSEIGLGPTRLLMGLGLSMGLFMVVVTGAELFTGNNLMLMGLFSRRIGVRALLRNWSLVYLGNLIGAVLIAGLVYFGRWWEQGDLSFAAQAINSAELRVNMAFETAFVRGILANILVCLAIWLATAGRSLTEKLIGVVLPVSAFIAAGYEHSVANMFFVPLGLMVWTEPEAAAAAGLTAGEARHMHIGWASYNLLAVTIGNIIGGGVMVGLGHWLIHRRAGVGEEVS